MSTLSVDNIIEKTSANGVTIDTLSIKDGNVVLAAGKGIDFSAATGSHSGSTSALLDDYEEGTWTPNCDNLGDAATYSGAKYTRIGRQVSFSFKVTMPSTSDGDSFVVSGLPFTADGDYAFACQINYDMNSLLHFAMFGSSTIIHGYYSGTNMQYSTISGKILIITGTYFTP
jgi:hypothetical protein